MGSNERDRQNEQMGGKSLVGKAAEPITGGGSYLRNAKFERIEKGDERWEKGRRRGRRRGGRAFS